MAKKNDGRYAAFTIPCDMNCDYEIAADAVEVKNVSLVPFSKAHKTSGYWPG